MTDWQPIETAPKDGTRILAWDSNYPIMDRDHFGVGMEVIEWVEPPGYWFHAGVEYTFDATHWIPLPTPPVAMGGKEE